MGKIMLGLENVCKDYAVAGGYVHALRGVSVNFRKNEFVAILGPSGCGKTTLLNVIGGLDHYTSGDMRIGGVSTKEYKEKDWNVYRNHTVGFVFQSYNLIPHQTVLANVELALTLSGVPKEERLRRAKEALTKVGLGDQLHKLPAQMSGGQMQRVAIARALVNDPEILLADEPTGALDSVTSVQIMDILKEISKDKLIIMVTHNPELAEQYATRIIRLKDGTLTDDSNPLPAEKETAPISPAQGKKKTSMSFFTALSLSFRNLMTKKARTLMISIAGSIGIIGIALILSVSSGVQAYIDSIEQSTMSNYPLSIAETSLDMTGMLSSMMSREDENTSGEGVPGRVYAQNVTARMLTSFSAGIARNDLAALKKYLESGKTNINELVHDIQYDYATDLNFYLRKTDAAGTVYYQRNLKDYYELFEEIGFGSFSPSDSQKSLYGSMTSSSLIFTELVGSADYVASQYDLVYGAYPSGENEVVILLDENGRISDYVLYMAGVLDVGVLKEYYNAMEAHRKNPDAFAEPVPPESGSYTYEELCALTFCLVGNAEFYTLREDGTAYAGTDPEKMRLSAAEMPAGREVRVVGILRPSENAVVTSGVGGIGYTEGLMHALMAEIAENPVVLAQKANPETDIFTGKPFAARYTLADYDEIIAYIRAHEAELSSYLAAVGVTVDELERLTDVTQKQQIVEWANMLMVASSSYEKNMSLLGYVEEDSPSAIRIYPKDFESKDKIVSILNTFSNTYSKLTYTDTIALMLSSVTTIVNAISYVLVAFVAISLVVSSIMIGVITYISVLERTKEIGILRAMGASRGDIGRVFNAETLVIGFAAGVLGILVSLLLIVVINIILHALTGIAALNAVLRPGYALILIAVSMVLTLIAGLIPSGYASRRDPVEALRSE